MKIIRIVNNGVATFGLTSEELEKAYQEVHRGYIRADIETQLELLVEDGCCSLEDQAATLANDSLMESLIDNVEGMDHSTYNEQVQYIISNLI